MLNSLSQPPSPAPSLINLLIIIIIIIPNNELFDLSRLRRGLTAKNRSGLIEFGERLKFSPPQ